MHVSFDRFFLIGSQVFFFICCISFFIRKYLSVKQTKYRQRGQSNQDYGIPCRTVRGEQVRSMVECFIANYLNTRGIEYRYEQPFLLKKKNEAVPLYPDFYLPAFDLLMEYWGLVEVTPEYQKEMRWKMALYHRNRVRLISIYPDNISFPFDPVDFDRLFQVKFQKATGIKLEPLTREQLAKMPHYKIIPKLDSKRLSQPVLS